MDKYVIAYLNNIIIYSKNKQEHKEHVKWVVRRLYKEQIPIIIKKYKFFTTRTEFIGFIIKLEQIRIDPGKVQCILKWKTLENVI